MTKTLGILGLGSRSTRFYIKEMNRLYHKKYGASTICPLKLLNTNFDEINNLLPQPSEQLDAVVKPYIKELLLLQVDHILVPNITLHQTLERLNINIPIIHPIENTILDVQKKHCKKIVLFGSLYTMQSNYVKSKFQESGIEVLIPTQNERVFIDEVRKQVYYERESSNLIHSFNLLIEKYCGDYGTVLACTELSIASNNNFKNLFDMSQSQLNAAIKAIDP